MDIGLSDCRGNLKLSSKGYIVTWLPDQRTLIEQVSHNVEEAYIAINFLNRLTYLSR